MQARILPHNKDIEENLIGTILLHGNGPMETALEFVNAECFYSDANKAIFEAFTRIYNSNRKIDMLTTMHELNAANKVDTAGGAYGLAQLTKNVTGASVTMTAQHSIVILEAWIKRELIKTSQDVTTTSFEYGSVVHTIVEDLEKKLFEITQRTSGKPFVHVVTAAMETVKEIENRIVNYRKDSNAITGVPSGLKKIDRVTHGWQPTDLVIVAARPSVGKTAFALNIARNAAMSKSKPTPVGIFSLEMSRQQLTTRMLADVSGLELDKLLTGNLTDDERNHMYTASQWLSEAQIYIDDAASLTMAQVRSKARRMKSKNKVGLIVIDYLQLISPGRDGKNKNREQQISEVSRELKQLAKELEVPVIALSQLSRAVEGRADRQPKLSDLRESGAIEQDADIVLFLYRPSKQDIEQDAELFGKGLIDIAKHRNGSLMEERFEFDGAHQRWTDGADRIPAPNTSYTWRPLQQPERPVRDISAPSNSDDWDAE
jgi:replicative DNA helicase